MCVSIYIYISVYIYIYIYVCVCVCHLCFFESIFTKTEKCCSNFSLFVRVVLPSHSKNLSTIRSILLVLVYNPVVGRKIWEFQRPFPFPPTNADRNIIRAALLPLNKLKLGKVSRQRQLPRLQRLRLLHRSIQLSTASDGNAIPRSSPSSSPQLSSAAPLTRPSPTQPSFLINRSNLIHLKPATYRSGEKENGGRRRNANAGVRR